MMNVKCDQCSKEFAVQTLVGQLPPHVPLKTFCEECFTKIAETSEQNTPRGDMRI